VSFTFSNFADAWISVMPEQLQYPMRFVLNSETHSGLIWKTNVPHIGTLARENFITNLLWLFARNLDHANKFSIIILQLQLIDILRIWKLFLNRTKHRPITNKIESDCRIKCELAISVQTEFHQV
jgi:hypothetical protein